MIKGKTLALIASASLILAGCVSQVIVEPLETAIPEPTETATLEPVSLEDIAIVDGDLPAGYEMGEVMVTLPPVYVERIGLPVVDFYWRKMTKGNKPAHTIIYVFPDEKYAEATLQALSGDLDTTDEYGEIGRLATVELVGHITVAAFVRCGVYVEIFLQSDAPTTVNYAIRLDRRIQESVCD